MGSLAEDATDPWLLNLGPVILISLLIIVVSPLFQAQALWLYVLTAVPVHRLLRR